MTVRDRIAPEAAYPPPPVSAVSKYRPLSPVAGRHITALQDTLSDQGKCRKEEIDLLHRLESRDARAYSPLALAFLGDSVFALMVRERLVCQANRPAGQLHALSVQQVRAEAQAEGAKRLLPCLTEEEAQVYKRGRNAHTGHLPKNANRAQYQAATGLEALFGYLYLEGRDDRLQELFSLLVNEEV